MRFSSSNLDDNKFMLVIAMGLLTFVNIAAIAYIGFWSLFVLGYSYNLAEKILNHLMGIKEQKEESKEEEAGLQ